MPTIITTVIAWMGKFFIDTLWARLRRKRKEVPVTPPPTRTGDDLEEITKNAKVPNHA